MINYLTRIFQILKKKYKNICAFFIILSLCCCGFTVIYKDRDQNFDISYVDELAAIKIKKNRDRISQELKNNLYDLLNPNNKEVTPKYFLTLSLKEALSPTFITYTGSSGRNRLTLTIDYELKDLNTGKLLTSGSTSVYDNYDVGSNRFGTYTAQNYTRSNLTITAAQNIRNSLVNDFIENHRTEERKALKIKEK